MGRLPRRLLLAASCLVALVARPVAAQEVEVQLREEGSRAPVIGAIVRLLGETGDQAHAQGLSNDGGRIVLRAPAAGRYRLKVDRIGWVGLVTPVFTLAEGQRFLSEVVLSDIRMDLPTVEVRGENVCGRRFEGQNLAANLWQEVHRALTATLLSQQEAGTALHRREFQRELRTNGRLESEWYTGSSVVRGQVYQTLPPALLAAEGFVLTDTQSDSTVYAVPDAALLVSDEFTGTHCFRTARGQAGLVGLAFEPVPGRKVADVTGTLWLDARTNELRYLEYTYVGLPGLPRRMEIGGRVDFERLPSGRWIVRSWVLRVPRVAQVPVRTLARLPGRSTGRTPVIMTDRIIGLLELGGEVRVAEAPGALVHHAVVAGRVTDPLTGAGLGGARVKVVGDAAEAETDAAGRFVLASSRHGHQVVTVQHPKFRLVSRPPDRPVILSVGDTVTVDFAAPTSAELVRTLCGNPRNRSGILGVVLDADGRPQWNALVTVSWPTPTGEIRRESVRTNADGIYAFCNLPPDEALTLSVPGPGGTPREEEVELAPREFAWLELRGGER